jgi:hypothetical protein
MPMMGGMAGGGGGGSAGGDQERSGNQWRTQGRLFDFEGRDAARQLRRAPGDDPER